ncbi:MAG: T9SS type A sorting domain-containing protein [Bacteroidales bacterium]|nr:T9SS type A sorting domain-containing protein [Bacteroidales bacterium]
MKTKALLFALIFDILGITTLMAQNALNYDGIDDCATFSYTPVTGSAARTIEAWIRTTDNYNPSAGGSQGVIADWGSMSPNGARFTFNVLWSNAIRLEVGGNGISGTTAVNDGQWHHVAAVYDPMSTPTIRLYTDGVLDGTGTPTVAVNTSLGNLLLGKRGDNINYFQGDIDEVRIWNVARSQTEIQISMGAEFCTLPSNLIAYYKANSGVAGGTNTGLTQLNDDSGNGHNGTLSGFSLAGNTSNWVSGAPLVGGSTTSSITASGCGSYTSPSGNHTWTTSGTYTDTLVNGIGCDSIITVNLDIVTVDLSMGLVGITLMSNAMNATYQWVDCDNAYALIAGAVQQQFTPTANGNYACIVTEQGCTDTTMCVPITTVGTEESLLSGVSVFPNPSIDGHYFVMHPAGSDAQLEVLDISGRSVSSVAASIDGRTSLHIERSGTYFIKYSNEKYSRTFKVAFW